MGEIRFDFLIPETATTGAELRQALGAAGVYLNPSHPISDLKPLVNSPSAYPSIEKIGGVDPDSETYFTDMGETRGD